MASDNSTHSILHVTDLHLADIDLGSREFLRKGYYREYLRSLWNSISPKLPAPVDAIVATGDFVDRGRTENFSHARSVLEELGKLAGVAKSEIVVCIGNHDIKRDEEIAKNHDAARLAFTSFSHHFANGNAKLTSHRATLITGRNGIHYLMLDGTRGAASPDVPGDLDLDATDKLINEYVMVVPENELLVIGSHYPIAPFPDDFSTHTEGPDYVRRHFWSAAVAFKRRVMSVRQKAATLWLFGDVHASDAYTDRSHIHVLSGRLGTRVPADSEHAESQRPRQARAVLVPVSDSSRAQLITSNFTLSSHAPQPEMGEWTASDSVVRRTDAFTSSSLISTGHSSEGTSKTAPPVCPVIVLDKDLNDLVYAKIRDDSLYRMGRFRTSGNRDSLGWVSVGQILGSGEYLARFCSASLEWLSKHFDLKPHRNGAGFVFVGIDCWGAAVASLLGSAAGATSLCAAVRADGRFHTTGELIDSDVAHAIERGQTIILVTDVIATGRSISALYSSIQKSYPDAVRAEQRWVALSVLVDGNRKSLDNCPFLAGVGVACADIKLPGIASEVLPSEDIAPAVVSFS